MKDLLATLVESIGIAGLIGGFVACLILVPSSIILPSVSSSRVVWLIRSLLSSLFITLGSFTFVFT